MARRAVSRSGCESALKRDSTSDRPQLLDTLKEILAWSGVPIGADQDPPRLMFSPTISVTCCYIGRGPASAPIHTLSLFGGFGPEVSRLCLCDSLPARSVRSQFRRDRRCYTEGAPLRAQVARGTLT